MVSEVRDCLLIRTDASAAIGWGHAIRTLALAQAWIKGNRQAAVVSSELPMALFDEWEASGARVVPLQSQPGTGSDATEFSRVARDSNASWVVLDGNNFDVDFALQLRSTGLRILRIDDGRYPARARHSDIVLNQNITASANPYLSENPCCELLLGPKYALLRQAFLAPWPERRLGAPVRRVLVTMGGSDVANVTTKVVEALASIGGRLMEVVVIIGGSNPHLADVQRQIARSRCECRIEFLPQNIANWMAWADLAISAAGSTCWELAHLGLPSLLVVCAEDQVPIAKYLHEHDYAVSLGWHESVEAADIARGIGELSDSPKRREAFAVAGRSLVDGQGVDRVIRAMTRSITLRCATIADSALLWAWANDPSTRTASFSSDPIPLAKHERWVNEKLRDPNCLLYIGEFQDVTVGQVRVDCQGREGIVSVSVAATQRGKGHGSAMLVKACQAVFEKGRLQLLHAYIKPENEASVRSFYKAGFKEQGMTLSGDDLALHLIKDRDSTL